MPAPRQQRILEAFADRLRTIRLVNGYRTDAGAAVFLEVPALGSDDPALGIAVVVGETARAERFRRCVTLPLIAVAVARADLADPVFAIQPVRADIKQAIEAGDPTFGGLLRSLDTGEEGPFPREPGSTVVGLQVPYLARYIEAWGDPEA